MTKGRDVVFHQAAIRITQCAEEPRLALEVLVDGTFTVLEAAVEHGVDKVVAASSASVYGLAEQFPTGERHHHHNNDTFYGAAKSFNEGMLRSFRAMYGLDHVLLRYFNVYGPRMDVHGVYTEVLVRWMERIADGRPPLIFGDGLQTMDFVYTEDIARANLLAMSSDVVEGVYNVAAGEETSLLDLARGPAARHGLRPRRRVRSRARGERGDPPAGGHLGRAPATWASSPRSGSRTACESSWSGGGRSATRSPAGRSLVGQGASRMNRIDVMQPWLGAGGGRRRHRGASSPAGSPRGPGWPPSRTRSRSACRPSTPSPCRAARPRSTWPCTSPASARATTSSSRRSRSSRPPTPSCTPGRRPVFADVDVGHRQPDRRDRRGGPHPGDPRRRRRRPGRRSGRPRSRPSPLRPPRHHSGGGRGLRGGLDLPGPACRRRRRDRGVVVPPPQDPHHR